MPPNARLMLSLKSIFRCTRRGFGFLSAIYPPGRKEFIGVLPVFWKAETLKLFSRRQRGTFRFLQDILDEATACSLHAICTWEEMKRPKPTGKNAALRQQRIRKEHLANEENYRAISWNVTRVPMYAVKAKR